MCVQSAKDGIVANRLWMCVWLVCDAYQKEERHAERERTGHMHIRLYGVLEADETYVDGQALAANCNCGTMWCGNGAETCSQK
jgi:hypothetical protein